MTHKLFEYYRKELQYLYDSGEEFARDHPDAAGMLDLQASPEEDPFVRRLVESFAFLNARTQMKLDEDFPHLATALLDNLMPLWNRPIPAFGVVEFEIEPQVAGKPGGELLERGVTRLEIPSMPGVAFRPCYDTVCTAVQISECLLRRSFPEAKHSLADKSVSVMKLSLNGEGGLPLKTLVSDSVRLYIEPEDYQFEIHEFLLSSTNLLGVSAIIGEQVFELPSSCLRCLGFEADEMVLDSPLHLPAEYQLIMELFAFPAKHMFFDLGLPPALKELDTSQIDYYFFFKDARPRLEAKVDRQTFRLNCAPIVNLFPVGPIARDLDRYSVDTLLDANQAASDFEIFSLDGIRAMDQATGSLLPVSPLYSVHHTGRERAHYHVRRCPRARGDGSDLLISIVDLNLDPYQEFGFSQLEFMATCCNRRFLDLKNADYNSRKLRVSSDGLINRAELVSDWQRMQQPPFESEVLWSLVSLLNLNYLLLHDQQATDTLRQVLNLLNRVRSNLVSDWIKSISRVETRRVIDRIEDGPWAAVAKGVEVNIELDPSRDQNPGSWYLFAMGVDRFVSLHANINSFTKTRFLSSENREQLVQFEQRCGKSRII